MAAGRMMKTISVSLAMVLTLQLTACGTVFYPERKGQKSGQIDPLVAVANAIGLLFYFIPGVIAFAVDFTTGAIYLPHGRHSSLTPEELKSVKDENGEVNTQVLNQILSSKFGRAIHVDAENVQVQTFTSKEALLAYFSRTQPQLAGL